MTVALVSGRNAQATGVDRYARSLRDALRAAGAEVEDVELRRREVRLGPLRAGGIASLWWQRLRVGRRDGWDLVHALDPAVATPASDVVTIHDLIPETHPEWGGRGAGARLDWALSRRNARRARHLVAISAATRDAILERWKVPEARVSVVRHGIDHARFRPVDARAPALAPDKPNLVYVGDDHPRKNLPLAYRALAALRDAHGVEARLVRVGPTRHPDQAARLRAFAARERLDVVEPGFLADDDLAALYSGAACFLWPTLAEGFGLPPLEAMACGAPVAALDTPVNREVVGPLGKYHAGSAEDAAQAVADAIAKPPARAALVAHAAGFTWRKAARETLAAYEKARASR